MKTLFSLVLFAIIVANTFSISSCVKDLPRDNPLDSANHTGTKTNNTNGSTCNVAITIASQNNATSNGGTGSATANPASGGVSPYTYNWTPIGGTNLTASNLPAGSYTITATDNKGCTAVASVTITQPSISAIKKINLSSYQITGQYALGSGGIYTTNTTVNPGDSTFLQINMINAGNVALYGIKINVSSTSSLIQIVPVQGGYYIECNGDITYDSLSVGQIGYAAITNGTFFTADPNSNFYAVNFKVSNSAVAGNKIPFTIQTSDNIGDNWTANFTLTVN